MRGHPLSSQQLREIVEGTAAETGEPFFDGLVRHLAQAVGTKCAWVTEWFPAERRLRALSFWAGDRYVRDYEYGIRGTPCERVIEDRRLAHVPDRVVELYHSDPDLAPLGAVSYLGVPLLDTDGGILGHLALLHDEPLPEDPDLIGIFHIFAGRAAAELRRLRRDRDLREREAKLSRLVESALDAIIELDAGLRIVTINPAAEEALACAPSEAAGQPLDRFLTPDSRGKLRYLAARLGERPAGRRTVWIADGITGIDARGRRFPAEGTLSAFETAGETRLALMLRDVHAREDAEARIRLLLEEAASLREQVDALPGFDDIVGGSAVLRAVLEDLRRVATGDTTVLITGETGTGKELLARAIHRLSPRARGPLVAVNCAAIAPSLQESEFFGHEKGAFTGATQRRDGRFKRADGGTIFLDEVGEMPLDLQGKLLRVLQEGEFEPLGSSRTERVDVRVIAATNRDLETMVRAGTLRQDLFYRLNVFPLRVPPLRERGDDVILLAETFAAAFARKRGVVPAPLDADQKARLRGYEWPGNVRELQNVIERALITSCDGRTLNLERALPEATPPGANPGRTAAGVRGVAGPADGDDGVLTAEELRDLERRNIGRALAASGGRIAGPGGAAERLGMHPNTLASRMKSLGLARPRGA